MSIISLSLDEKEQSAFMQLIDVALRQAGLGALDVAAHFKVKLDAAIAAQATVQESAVPPAPEEAKQN